MAKAIVRTKVDDGHRWDEAKGERADVDPVWKDYELIPGQTYTIGRSEDRKNDGDFIYHLCRSFSRTHGELTLTEEGDLHYRDLGSMNGSAISDREEYEVPSTSARGEPYQERYSAIVPAGGITLRQGDRIMVPAVTGEHVKLRGVSDEKTGRSLVLTNRTRGFKVEVVSIEK
jgi:pSer/pThr/pTyr-binding forkhead associated (FHA) protein